MTAASPVSSDRRDPGLAAVLEILPAVFLQTFGIGHIYAGDIGGGLVVMIAYWVLSAINFALCFVFIGFITWPLTFHHLAADVPALLRHLGSIGRGEGQESGRAVAVARGRVEKNVPPRPG